MLIIVRNILVLFILMGASLAQAQTGIMALPVSASATVRATDLDVAARATFKNTSTTNKTYRWTRKIKTLSTGWSVAVGDKNGVNIMSTDTMRFTLAPGEETNLDVHIYPNGINGSAQVELLIYDIADPASRQTYSYSFNQNAPSREPGNGDQIVLYPNPAYDYFKVEAKAALAKVELYNLAGSQVKTFYAYPDKRYMINDINSGVYLVRLLDVNNKVLKSMRLNKR